MRRTELTVEQILSWADAYHERTGEWPDMYCGRVWEPANETWSNIDQALRKGLRGLHRGQSLARVLAKYRGKRNRKGLSKYTLNQILKWADEYHKQTGKWPHHRKGPIAGTNGESWWAVDMALRTGLRGLPGGSTLAKLLAAKRRVRHHRDRPRLSQRKILRWADAHRQRTGNWPTTKTGTIADQPSDTWCAIDKALRAGRRGLRGKTSLAKLLSKHRQVSRHVRRQPLSPEIILKWADAYYERTGKWPREGSGLIPEAPGETWQRVQSALLEGKGGLPGGETLTYFLATRKKLRNKVTLPKLTDGQILAWAKAFNEQNGYWPSRNDGLIPHSDGETWSAIENGLKHGGRGLRGGTTLSKLIRGNFGIEVSRLVRSKTVARPSSR